ncbi:protein-disulfide reductase DsbD [Castellaniella sp.]|uniref:protein-disulfide reductase DsbD n=1 Tax=Castellaniella sp. TaxID=1955812 RepID=UPI002AFDCBB6|nr:protein-disulfide reductase DsbD [Castellaniella sp.]
MKKFLSLLLMSLMVLGVIGKAWAADDFLDPEKAFIASVATPDPLTLDVHYAIAPGYYMYQERFEVRIEDAQGQLLLYRQSTLTPPGEETRQPAWTQPLLLPKGQVKHDPTFERDMEVFHRGVTLRAPLKAGAATPLQVTVTGQGCADEGLCYPPMTMQFTLVAQGGGYQAQGPLVRAQVPAPQDEGVAPVARAPGDRASGPGLALALPAGSAGSARSTASGAPDASWLDLGDVGMAAWLHQAPLWQILGLSLLFGILLSFTPCVLPMVPILLAIIAGQDQQPISRSRGLSMAAIYVLGMSIVYTVLGVVAGLVGAGLAAWLQSPWVLGSFAVLLALFALAMLDVFTLQAPVGLQSRMQGWMQRLPGGRVGGVFLMGMISALIVGPCVAAPLAGVLLFISQTGDVVIGGSALFAMAWGEGLLLLLVGAGAGALLPRAGAWMMPLKAAFGLLLLATAWWMAQPLLAGTVAVTGWILLALWAALVLWHATSGRSMAQGDAPPAAGPLRLLTRALALMLALWGLAQGAGLLAGGQDMLRPLAPFAAGSGSGGVAVPGPDAIRARFTPVTSLADLDAKLAASDRPVMLDFYADWCVSCLEMEKFTFSDPRVAARMGQMTLLQADVTRMTADDRALLARFDLFGPPGILFFDRQGQLLTDARVVGFKKADAFLPVQDQVLGTR